MKRLIGTLIAVAALLAPSAPAVAADDDAATWTALIQGAPSGGVGGKRISDFPGVLRLPPTDFIAEQHVPVISTGYDEDKGLFAAGYAVRLTERPGLLTPGRITLHGWPGRDVFDAMSGPSDLRRCNVTQSYCASGGIGNDETFLTNEQFYGLVSPSGHLAVVGHTTCCNGEYWLLFWYEPDLDATYSESFELDAGLKLGAQGITEAHADLAQTLVDATDTFVSVDPPSFSTDLSPFLGFWYGHGRGVTITPDKHGKYSSRTYQPCDRPHTGPCDAVVNNQMVYGNVIMFTIEAVYGGNAIGVVTAATDHTLVGKPVSVTLDQKDTIDLEVNDAQYGLLCGPRAPSGYCGA